MLRDLTPADRTKLRDEFLQQAGAEFERMFAAKQQTELVTFDQRESRALAIGKGLARWLLGQHLRNDAKARSVRHATEECPRCKRRCNEKEPPDDASPSRQVQTGAGMVDLTRSEFFCADCRRAFFPLDIELGLRTEGYGPSVLRKIEYAGGNAPSFPLAHDALTRLAEITTGAKHIERLTKRVGQERQALRDETVEAFQKRVSEPRYQDSPGTVAIFVDASKIQLRADDGAPGVRSPRWADTKVACLATYGPLHFPGWVQILDFVHLLVHLHAAANAAWSRAPKRAWALYVKLLRHARSGQAGEVHRELERQARRRGEPPPKADDADPRRRLALVIP